MELLNTLILICVCALLGCLGQGVRTLLGYWNNKLQAELHKDDGFEDAVDERIKKVESWQKKYENLPENQLKTRPSPSPQDPPKSADELLEEVYKICDNSEKQSKQRDAFRREINRLRYLKSRHKDLYPLKFDKYRLAYSVSIALTIGAIAGVIYPFTGLVSNASPDHIWSTIFVGSNLMKTVVAFVPVLAAGYAGTDFIENFMKKNWPVPSKIDK